MALILVFVFNRFEMIETLEYICEIKIRNRARVKQKKRRNDAESLLLTTMRFKFSHRFFDIQSRLIDF